MEAILTKLSSLSITFNGAQCNGVYVCICFGIYDHFRKFLELFAECKMSSQLSKQIHFAWIVEFVQSYAYLTNVKNIFDLISNFSNEELLKLQTFAREIATGSDGSNICYRVIFPIADIEMVSSHLSVLILKNKTNYCNDFVSDDDKYSEMSTVISYECSDNDFFGEPMDESCEETMVSFNKNISTDDLVYSDSDDDL